MTASRFNVNTICSDNLLKKLQRQIICRSLSSWALAFGLRNACIYWDRVCVLCVCTRACMRVFVRVCVFLCLYMCVYYVCVCMCVKRDKQRRARACDHTEKEYMRERDGMRVIPVWHITPVKPRTHEHWKLPTKLRQLPPFWHGLLAHSSISEKKYYKSTSF